MTGRNPIMTGTSRDVILRAARGWMLLRSPG